MFKRLFVNFDGDKRHDSKHDTKWIKSGSCQCNRYLKVAQLSFKITAYIEKSKLFSVVMLIIRIC